MVDPGLLACPLIDHIRTCKQPMSNPSPRIPVADLGFGDIGTYTIEGDDVDEQPSGRNHSFATRG